MGGDAQVEKDGLGVNCPCYLVTALCCKCRQVGKRGDGTCVSYFGLLMCSHEIRNKGVELLKV